VGCAAMMIACKYEQCYLIGGGVSECPDYLQECPHEVQDFVHLCAGAYTAEDVLGVSSNGPTLSLKRVHSKHAASRGHRMSMPLHLRNLTSVPSSLIPDLYSTSRH
jgi:hypothetical protein